MLSVAASTIHNTVFITATNCAWRLVQRSRCHDGRKTLIDDTCFIRCRVVTVSLCDCTLFSPTAGFTQPQNGALVTPLAGGGLGPVSATAPSASGPAAAGAAGAANGAGGSSGSNAVLGPPALASNSSGSVTSEPVVKYVAPVVPTAAPQPLSISITSVGGYQVRLASRSQLLGCFGLFWGSFAGIGSRLVKCSRLSP